MYKMGVMSTLLVVLTALTLKSVLIGKLLLLLNASAIIAKIIIFAKGAAAPVDHAHSSQKDVHVHIHNDRAPSEHAAVPHWAPSRYDQAYDVSHSQSPGWGPSHYSSPYGTPYGGHYGKSFPTDDLSYEDVLGTDYAYERTDEDNDRGLLGSVVDSLNRFSGKTIPIYEDQYQ